MAMNDEQTAAGEQNGGMTGYVVAYGRDEAPFPVYVAAGLAAILLTAAAFQSNVIFLGLGLVATAFAYYNWPLAEIGRPRLGANQYGIFIEGFGVIAWRAVDRLELIEIAVRAVTRYELQIGLRQPLTRALMKDWRNVPWWRRFMRLPWSMGHDNTIRVSLDAMDRQPDDIHRTFQRMWRHYRS